MTNLCTYLVVSINLLKRLEQHLENVDYCVVVPCNFLDPF